MPEWIFDKFNQKLLDLLKTPMGASIVVEKPESKRKRPAPKKAAPPPKRAKGGAAPAVASLVMPSEESISTEVVVAASPNDSDAAAGGSSKITRQKLFLDDLGACVSSVIDHPDIVQSLGPSLSNEKKLRLTCIAISIGLRFCWKGSVTLPGHDTNSTPSGLCCAVSSRLSS
jgi:hypothetical protein